MNVSNRNGNTSDINAAISSILRTPATTIGVTTKAAAKKKTPRPLTVATTPMAAPDTATAASTIAVTAGTVLTTLVSAAMTGTLTTRAIPTLDVTSTSTSTSTPNNLAAASAAGTPPPPPPPAIHDSSQELRLNALQRLLSAAPGKHKHSNNCTTGNSSSNSHNTQSSIGESSGNGNGTKNFSSSIKDCKVTRTSSSFAGNKSRDTSNALSAQAANRNNSHSSMTAASASTMAAAASVASSMGANNNIAHPKSSVKSTRSGKATSATVIKKGNKTATNEP
jgi:hypothetical protein